MDLRYTADEQQFRADLRQWLGDVLPSLGPEPHREDWDARRAWDTGWQRMLFDAGYAGINWPKEYGGRGATPAEHLIFIEETERARAPYVGMNFVGLLHAGPRSSPRRPTSRRRSTCPASSRASTSGARASPSPTPAPTSPASAAARCATATTT